MKKLSIKKLQILRKEFHAELDSIKVNTPDKLRNYLPYHKFIQKMDPAWYKWAWENFKYNSLG